MSSLYDDLVKGLNEAIDYEKGRGKAKVTRLTIAPVRKYAAKEIRETRIAAGMTQTVFATYLGVSVKTVEAWERGRSSPTGPANRLIDMLEKGQYTSLPFVSYNAE